MQARRSKLRKKRERKRTIGEKIFWQQSERSLKGCEGGAWEKGAPASEKGQRGRKTSARFLNQKISARHDAFRLITSTCCRSSRSNARNIPWKTFRSEVCVRSASISIRARMCAAVAAWIEERAGARKDERNGIRLRYELRSSRRCRG